MGPTPTIVSVRCGAPADMVTGVSVFHDWFLNPSRIPAATSVAAVAWLATALELPATRKRFVTAIKPNTSTTIAIRTSTIVKPSSARVRPSFERMESLMWLLLIRQDAAAGTDGHFLAQVRAVLLQADDVRAVEGLDERRPRRGVGGRRTTRARPHFTAGAELREAHGPGIRSPGQVAVRRSVEHHVGREVLDRPGLRGRERPRQDGPVFTTVPEPVRGGAAVRDLIVLHDPAILRGADHREEDAEVDVLHDRLAARDVDLHRHLLRRPLDPEVPDVAGNRREGHRGHGADDSQDDEQLDER